MKRYTFSCCYLLLCFQLSAQCPPAGFPYMGNTCSTAPVICESLHGYCSSLSSNNTQQIFPGCGGGWTLNNDEWIGFYAATNAITIQITPVNCVGGTGNTGMQGGIFTDCVGNLALDIQCSCTDDPFLLSASNFVIGQVYWLLLDGCAGDICDYQIQVLQGKTGTCVETIALCSDTCVTVCDSVFCHDGVYTAMCPDSTGALAPHQFQLEYLHPQASILGGGSITCNNAAVSLTAQNPDGQIAWINQAGQIVGTDMIVNILTPGYYTLKVTDGPCEAKDKVLIKQHNQPPHVSATGGTLDATHPSIQLTGHSITSGVVYAWVGPGGFVSTQKNPVVSQPGTYTLTVTLPATGCSNSAEAIVIQN